MSDSQKSMDGMGQQSPANGKTLKVAGMVIVDGILNWFPGAPLDLVDDLNAWAEGLDDGEVRLTRVTPEDFDSVDELRNEWMPLAIHAKRSQCLLKALDNELNGDGDDDAL